MRPLVLAFASLLVAGSLARGARAQSEPPQPPAPPAVDHRVEMWRLELGWRGSLVSDAGLDPFAKDDYMAQGSLAASRTLLVRGRFSFAPGIAWDFGGTSATARGDATSLSVHRLTVPLEGRAHFGAWGYAYLRVAPGAVVESAQIDDASSPAPLTKSRWLFATDVSAGYAWLAWPWREPDKMAPRLWVQSDVGYGWAAREHLDLAPDLASGDPQRVGRVDLGSLALRGPFLRIAVAVSF